MKIWRLARDVLRALSAGEGEYPNNEFRGGIASC